MGIHAALAKRPAMASNVCLEAIELYGGYGQRAVVRGASFSLRPGELTGLTGPNGAGKSTLLRLVSGTLKPASGEVRLRGLPLDAYSSRDLARLLAYVPQSEPSLFDFTVRDVVMMGRHAHVSRIRGEQPVDYEIVARAMGLADVAHLADRPVTTLSGGEHRRVLLARAIAQAAPVMLLDEPTAHMDLSHQHDALRLVAGLTHEQGVAALVAIHDLNVAAEHCQRLIMLSRGSMLADGSPEEVLQTSVLEEAYGTSVIVARNPVSGRPLVVPCHRTDTGAEDADDRVHLICGGGSGIEAMAELVRSGWRLTAGVLNVLDSDHEAARALGVQCIEETPFSPISDRAFNEALATAAEVTFVVVTAMPLGKGNVRNLELALRLARSGRVLVLITDGPVEARDFTEGEGARLWHELEKVAATIIGPEQGIVPVLRSLRHRRAAEDRTTTE